MAYEDRDYAVRMRLGPGSTPRVIKILVLLNVAVWLFQAVWAKFIASGLDTHLEFLLGVSTRGLAGNLYLWQPVTYMFLHTPLGSPLGILHILFNMMILWMFGSSVAGRLGTRTFLGLYFGAGIFAGLCYAAFAALDMAGTPCIGASGAVMGVIVYAGLLDPDRQVLFAFFIPMRLRTLVWVVVGMDLFFFVVGTDSGVAHTAHLGGALFGWLHYRYAHVLDRYFARMEVKAQQQKAQQDASIREEVDRLLAKIHEEGLGSLSDREKKFLKRSSSRYEKK